MQHFARRAAASHLGDLLARTHQLAFVDQAIAVVAVRGKPLLVVLDDDQWLSAYGHNRNRLVNEGQLVRSGQQIAEMGRSGAPREMLHFEVRYNGKPIDPLIYLPKR